MLIKILLMIFFSLLSGFSSAIMDKICFHWNKSIFNIEKPTTRLHHFILYFFADHYNVGWKNKYNEDGSRKKISFFKIGINIPVQFCDAWHFFKSIKIISLIMCGFFIVNTNVLAVLLSLLIIGIVYNCTFNISFKYIFSK
jgi:hypothetical protein